MSDPRSEELPPVSVVIPCRNAAGLVGLQLDALARQEYAGEWEVIVADNGSTDALSGVIEQFQALLSGLRLVDASDKAGVNHARNQGVEAARHDVVLLCDADDIVQPGWLGALGRASLTCDVLGGPLEPFLHAPGPITSSEESGTAALLTLGFLPYAIGANMGFTQSVWRAIGGFDEDFIERADEIDFCWRAQMEGFRLCFVPEAGVWYRLRSGRRARMRQARKAAIGHVRLYRKHRSNGFRRRNPVVGLVRRCGRLVVDLPRALRGGDSLTEWLCYLAALVGHVEGAFKFRTWCP